MGFFDFLKKLPTINEILAGLGEMYIADERFKTNIDKNAQGTAQLVSAAIKIFCNSK